VVHDGKRYDSKAVAGVAHGKQFPTEGPLASSDFSGGDTTVKAKLEQLGFEVVGPPLTSDNHITAADIKLLQQSRSKGRYANITPEQREAYKKIHSALDHLGGSVVDVLGGPEHYEVRLTSGFHLASGVRGAIPKDLWFGVFRRENRDTFLGNPQLIVLGHSLQYGRPVGKV
jgi:hypothetical protein